MDKEPKAFVPQGLSRGKVLAEVSREKRRAIVINCVRERVYVDAVRMPDGTVHMVVMKSGSGGGDFRSSLEDCNGTLNALTV